MLHALYFSPLIGLRFCMFEFHTLETVELVGIPSFKGAREYPCYIMPKESRNQKKVDSLPLTASGSCLGGTCAFFVPVSLDFCKVGS